MLNLYLSNIKKEIDILIDSLELEEILKKSLKDLKKSINLFIESIEDNKQRYLDSYDIKYFSKEINNNLIVIKKYNNNFKSINNICMKLDYLFKDNPNINIILNRVSK